MLFIIKNNALISYLEYHLKGKNACENIVEIGENVIPLTVFLNWVFSGQSHAAHDDDHHDERVEERIRHDAVNKNANAKRDKTKCCQISILLYSRSVIKATHNRD